MPLITPAPQLSPAKAARIQIEAVLAESLQSALKYHGIIGRLLNESNTGATAEEIIAEFGEDAPLLLEARKKAQEAMAAVDPALAEVFDAHAQSVEAVK